MNDARSLILAAISAVLLAGGAVAQEEPEEYPEYGDPAAEESDSGTMEEPPADDGYGSYEEPAPADDSSYDSAAYGAEEPAEEEVAEEEGESWPWYAGVDVVQSTLSSSNLSGFGTQDYDSGIYRLKFGTRIFDNRVGVEAHYGLDNGDEVATDDYYGIFIVPTATVLETFELALPLGYAMTSVSRPGGGADLDSVAYGFDAQLPLRLFDESMPNLRFTLGWMVYYQKRDARLYGANLGIRYDFGGDS